MVDQLVTYQGRDYDFDYPASGELIHFKSGTLRVRIGEWRFNIKPWKHDATAESAAHRIYTTIADWPNDSFALPPYRLEAVPQPGWRCRKRFVDGGQAPLVIDMVFYQKGEGQIFHLEFATPPAQYESAFLVFEPIINTFVIKPT